MNYIMDLVVISVFVIFVVSGYKRGILNSVAHLVGSAVSCVLSVFIASFLADNFYFKFIQPKIIEAVEKNMPQITMATSPKDIAGALMSDLPDFAKNALSMSGINTASLTQEISSSPLNVPDVLEGMIRPIIIKLLAIIIGLALFTVFAAVISLLTRSVTSAVDFAGLSILNRISGALLGLLAAVVIIMVLMLVLYILIVLLPDNSSMALREGINSTHLLKYIYEINVPEMIIDAMHGI